MNSLSTACQQPVHSHTVEGPHSCVAMAAAAASVVGYCRRSVNKSPAETTMISEDEDNSDDTAHLRKSVGTPRRRETMGGSF